MVADLDRGTRAVVATLDQVNQTLDAELGNTAADRPVLDGSLCSWELVPETARARVLNELEAAGGYDIAFPESFAHMLGMYPECPGSWLIQPRRAMGLSIDPEIAERTLNGIISQSFNGQHPVPTRAKAMALRGLVVADKIKFAKTIETVDLLPRYPHDLSDDELARVESFIRASFGATDALTEPGADEGSQGCPSAWAARFWRANWSLYPCHTGSGSETLLNSAELEKLVNALSDSIENLWERFESKARATDPDIYNPDRFEVLTGISARALRLLTVSIHSPISWTSEHSAALVRGMVEALITLTWLLHREEDGVYRRFKDFGRGHLKLLKLHLEEYVDALDDPPADLVEQVRELDVIVNEEVNEEYQDIDIGGSFAGIDMRKMAMEVGLEREYRLVLAPSSADFHGEWGHLSRYALTICGNPAHRLHRIPRQDIQPHINPAVIQTALSFAERIVAAYEAGMDD